MNHISFKTIHLILTAALIMLFTSCQTVPTEVPENLTKADLIQLAQDSYEAGNTNAAEFYYEVILERFEDDVSAQIVAKFEIAHLHIKEKDYKTARPILEEIIECFDSNEELLYTLPEYLKLARIDLAKCE